MNTTSRRLAAHYLYVRRSLLKNPILSLTSDGTVTGIEVCHDPDSREGVEFYPGILVPSMVNAHCHLELSYLKGRIADGRGLAAFAKDMGEVRNVFDPAQEIAAALAADAKMWHGGIGAVGDICNDASTFGIKGASRIYYHNFLELFGLQSNTLDALRPTALAANKAGLAFSPTPHSLYSLNKKGYAAAIDGFGENTTDTVVNRTSDRQGSIIPGLQYENCSSLTWNTNPADDSERLPPLSVHFMESASEAELFSGIGELAQWYALRGLPVDFTEYGSPVERLIAQTPPERDIMLIHNCFVTSEVVDCITSHFTGRVTWVLCPRSNRFISQIAPPYDLLRRKGMHIALGTDSLASNHSLDLVAEMRMFDGVPLEELLGWAVENGAEALGIPGGFELGRRTGAAVLSGIDWQTMSLTPDSKATRIV